METPKFLYCPLYQRCSSFTLASVAFFFFSFLASQTVEVTYEVDEDDSGGVACTYGVSGIALLLFFGSNLTEESRNVPSFTIQKAPSNKFQNLTHSQI